MLKSVKFGAIFFVWCVVQNSMAAETAKVLPKGIFRFRVVGVQTSSIEDKLNREGQIESMSRPMNRTVTTKDFVAKQPELGSLVNALNALKPGSGDQLLNANTYSGFSMSMQTVMPAIEYGVNDRLSIGVRAPVVRRTLKADFHAELQNNALAYKNQIGGLSAEASSALDKVAALTGPSLAAASFTDNGYEVPHGFQKTELGDVELGGKYNFYKNEGLYLTSLVGMRAPTGSTPSLTNVYDTGTGNGSWAVALQNFQEYEATNILSFGAMQKLTQNLPDTRARAVPKNPDDTLPSLLPQNGQVEDVRREQALELDTELSSTLYFMDRTWSTWAAWQYNTKAQDKYYGSRNLYYDGLATGSSRDRHNGELGVGYSTIPAFRRKTFAMPLEIQALYNTVFVGRNVPNVSYGRLDLIVYF